jgi:serine/threonine-protein kinase HipA
LLRAIGGECAGTLSILQAEYSPSLKHHYYELSPIELAQLVSGKGQFFSWGAIERPRYSLAGAQDKCTILIAGDNYLLPQKESSSSHILKFELADYRHLPAYEIFTTLLASAIGLPVMDVRLKSINESRVAIIKRYDRQINSQNQITRLHQEDFCQALGIDHELKYQQDGGPSFVDCYRLLQDVSSDPAVDLQYLLNWQIFNVLAGNSDGHAKNLSLLYLPHGEIRLAPFYDLICTRAIERIDYHLAFAIGDEYNPSVITAKHWSDLAQSCGLHPELLLSSVYIFANLLLKKLQSAREIFETLYGSYPALQRVEQVIIKQCRRALTTQSLNE